jgi:predicted lipoprotein with Yx(FWY)xxD motif
MVKPRSLLFIGLALVGVLVLTSVAFAQGTSTVQVTNNATYGQILTNGQGMTLYELSSDSAGNSTCTGACAQAWPPLTVSAGQTPAAGSNATAKLGTITRSDGTTQVTANNMPLYTFVRDTAAGDVKGQGITAFGGTWHVVDAAGNAVMTAAAKGTATGTASATPAGPRTLPTTGGNPSSSTDIALLAGLALAAFGAAITLKSTRRAR